MVFHLRYHIHTILWSHFLILTTVIRSYRLSFFCRKPVSASSRHRKRGLRKVFWHDTSDYRKWRHRRSCYRRSTDHVTGDSNSFTHVRLQSRFRRRRRRQRVSSAAVELNVLGPTTQSLIEWSDVINWLKLINGIPLFFDSTAAVAAAAAAAERPSSTDSVEGSPACRAGVRAPGAIEALISPGAGFIKSRALSATATYGRRRYQI